jgi:hypothetical protein
MVNSAIYPNLSGPLPAVMSPEIYRQELRIVAPQAPPLTISDDLEAPALAHQPRAGEEAFAAGLDLLLYAQTSEASANGYHALLKGAHAGRISLRRIAQAADAIHALKRTLAHH